MRISEGFDRVGPEARIVIGELKPSKSQAARYTAFVRRVGGWKGGSRAC